MARYAAMPAKLVRCGTPGVKDVAKYPLSRNGALTPDDHPLVREGTLIDRIVGRVSVEDGGKGSTDRIT